VQQTNSLERVHEGMSVVDVTGERLGTVAFVAKGDPSAASVRASSVLAGEVFGLPANDGAGADLPVPEAPELLRLGYIEISGAGFADIDRYARADLVADVSDGVVSLSASKSALFEAMW
jgi:hypothetical protein